MDYAFLFSGMGVMIIYLTWKIFMLASSRNYYRRVITGIALGDYKVKIEKDGEYIHTEITEVRK